MFSALPLADKPFTLQEILLSAIKSNSTDTFAYIVEDDNVSNISWGQFGHHVANAMRHLEKHSLDRTSEQKLVVGMLGTSDYSYAVYIVAVILSGGVVCGYP